MRDTPNIGQIGLESVRIGGMKVCDLPIGEQARTIPQLRLVEDTERQNKIEGIIAKYPKQRVGYLAARVKECNENITRLQTTLAEQNKLINEYTAQISLCEFRDKELAKTSDEVEIKSLKKKYPPYNVDAMNKQIDQSRESIERIDVVIKKEFDSISELNEVMMKCSQRDTELKALGVTQAVG